MIRDFLVCLPILWGWGMLEGQAVSVHARHESYKLVPVHVTIAWNPFITIPEYTEIVTCDETGALSDTFEVTTGRVVQFEAGGYESYLYVEPGYHYEVELPVYQEIKYSDRISPYFQPRTQPVKLLWRRKNSSQEIQEGSLDVNIGIARFDSLFTSFNQEVVMSRRLSRTVNTDSMIREMESVFSGDTSIFFKDYRRYRYGILKYNEGRTGLADLSRRYLGPEVNESNPGFTELFRTLFADFLFYFSQTHPGTALRTEINRTHRLDSIRGAISKHEAIWNDTLADMVILLELTNQFYSGSYHKAAILILLDSLASDPKSDAMGIYAAQIRNKLSSLMVGNRPPQFTLQDTEGNPWTPDLAGERYLYLMFCSPDLYGCMVEYPFLQSYQSKHAGYLEVVTIMVAENRQEVRQFMEKNGYEWKALYYADQPYLLDDYLVRAFPTAYLVGPDGTLVLSPATLPSEGFEQQLFRIMRSRGEI